MRGDYAHALQLNREYTMQCGCTPLGQQFAVSFSEMATLLFQQNEQSKAECGWSRTEETREKKEKRSRRVDEEIEEEEEGRRRRIRKDSA